jgi:gentisate 1,2-dioxygenase
VNIAPSSALQAFSAQISPLALSPLWERKARLTPGSDCVSAVWHYTQMRPLLAQAAELISQERAERRVLVMENPSQRGSSYITPALYAGLQIIKPGEVARSHRHTPSALRFVVEGEGAYTRVGGQRVDMRPGDFVVTPAWDWHEHGNEGAGPVVWMDGLDTPIAALCGAHFREDDTPARQRDAADAPPAQPLIHTFDATREALRTMARSGTIDAAQGFKRRYPGPHNGHALRTMAAFMQLLPAGFRGHAYRATDGSVFNVAQGQCRVELAGQWHSVQARDVFVVPPWEPYRFEADGDCLLFSFSDRAAQEALGYWREQR